MCVPKPAVSQASHGRVAAIDGLRGLAILSVVLAHCFGIPGFPFPASILSNALGNLGVRLFFVLSGFLITSLLLSEEMRSGTISLSGFYLRRSFRIFPAFYVYLGIVAFLAALGIIQLSRHSFLTAAVYLSNYIPYYSAEHEVRHFWSLAVEEQFYLLWPLLFLLLRSKRKTLLLSVLVVLPVWRILIYSHTAWGFAETIDRRFDAVADTLATGCLLAVLNARPEQITNLRRLVDSPWRFAILSVGVLTAFTAERPRTYYGVGQTVINLCLAVLIDRVVRWPDSQMAKFFRASWLVFTGRISYSLYLWQQIFLRQGLPDTIWVPLAVPFSFMAAYVSFRVIEQPMLRFKDGLLKKA